MQDQLNRNKEIRPNFELWNILWNHKDAVPVSEIESLWREKRGIRSHLDFSCLIIKTIAIIEKNLKCDSDEYHSVFILAIFFYPIYLFLF